MSCENDIPDENKKPDKNSVVPVEIKTTPTSAKDPIASMIEIAVNGKLNDKDKARLIQFAMNRFKNRRRMAYIALYALVVSLALILIAAFIDGLTSTEAIKEATKRVGILKSIKESQTLFIWLEGFFAAIVGAYYGISSWRPSS